MSVMFSWELWGGNERDFWMITCNSPMFCPVVVSSWSDCYWFTSTLVGSGGFSCCSFWESMVTSFCSSTSGTLVRGGLVMAPMPYLATEQSKSRSLMESSTLVAPEFGC